jgi:hypothetical protein
MYNNLGEEPDNLKINEDAELLPKKLRFLSGHSKPASYPSSSFHDISSLPNFENNEWTSGEEPQSDESRFVPRLPRPLPRIAGNWRLAKFNWHSNHLQNA